MQHLCLVAVAPVSYHLVGRIGWLCTQSRIPLVRYVVRIGMKVHRCIIQRQTTRWNHVHDSLKEISYNKYMNRNKTRQDEVVTDIRAVHFSKLEDDVQGQTSIRTNFVNQSQGQIQRDTSRWTMLVESRAVGDLKYLILEKVESTSLQSHI